MVPLETQKKILIKALGTNKVSFIQNGDAFVWNGAAKIKSHTTGKVYNITVEIFIKSSKRLTDQISACLCKQEGVRFEDLVIVSMIDPRILGNIIIAGLPNGDAKHSFIKFLKQVG